MERDLYMVYERKIEGNYLDCHKGISIMSQLVLSMTRIPLYVSDYEIARVWKEYNGSIVNSVRFEPNQDTGYRKATVWFSDLVGHLPYPYWSAEQTTSIFSNNYKKSFLPGAEKLGNILGFLESCSPSLEEPRDFSFIMTLQLQDIVRKQAEHIERLEASNVYLQDNQTGQANRIQNLESRLNEMETRVNEGTELYMDINQSSMDAFRRMKSKLRYHKTYIKRLEANITALQSKEKDGLKQKIDALTEWCSQPLWKRSSAFVMPEESNCEFISEF